jgi:hypothetical protein
MEICCEYEIPEMVSLITSYLCRRHGHRGVPDVMMSLKGAIGGPRKGQREVLRGTEGSFIFIFDHSATFTFGTYMEKIKKRIINR